MAHSEQKAIGNIREKSRKALQRAIDAAGGQENLAVAIGSNQSTISFWLNTAKKGVAAEYCPIIEQVTGVPKEELRPEAYRTPVSTKRRAA